MISDESQNPDLANNTNNTTEVSFSDVWSDSPSDEPEVEQIPTAEELPVIDLKPKSQMEGSGSDDSVSSEDDLTDASDSVTEVMIAEVSSAPIGQPDPIAPEETSAQETPTDDIEPKLTDESADGAEASTPEQLGNDVVQLRRQKEALEAEILQLEANRGRLLQENITELQGTLGQMIQESLGELQQRKQALQVSVEQLERRQERIRKEMQTTFAGVSQDLAIRVQGFKDYLVGSLQDLVTAAEELDIAPKQRSPEPMSEPSRSRSPGSRGSKGSNRPNSAEFGQSTFDDQAQKIRRILKQFRTQPDYYGPPWQLRRTFEPIHAERVSNWFFTQGGRGALRTMGSRLQNILIASAVMSCLRKIYGNRFRTLVLANSPERLGEWRRGLQDCLGISRNDFGPERGVVLFEDPEALSQKAERLVKDGLMPLILIDEAEGQINLAILQFPLWLAFAAEPRMSSSSSSSNW